MGVNGFRRQPAKLDFDSPELAGLDVRARRLSVREIRDIQTPPEDSTRAERERFLEGVLVDAVESWNYFDGEGELVPLEVDALDERVDPAVIGEVIDALIKASTRVAPPLPRRSDAGTPSPEEFKLMETLSDSPESSPGPDSS